MPWWPKYPTLNEVAFPKACCNLQTPSLILRRVHPLLRNSQPRPRKVWDVMLKAGEGLTQGEALHERFIGQIGHIVEKTSRRFTGRKVVLDGAERIDHRRIIGEPGRETYSQRIVEDTHASAEHRIVRYTEWLPREAEAWRP